MIRSDVAQSHFLERYKQGKWDSTILTCALERALVVERPIGWIDYLDVCFSIQGVTLEQWLNAAQLYRSYSSCSPKLLLRLCYLMSTPGVIEPLSESCRQEYCKTLNTFSRYSGAGLISDMRRSGYLGCRLKHYPGLLAQISTPLPGLLYQGCSRKTHKQKAQTLATRVTPFNELVRQASADSVGNQYVKSPCRIAVVGNSPAIKQVKQGGEIDSADIVIRFNNSAVTQENHMHCGTRTDLWVMSPATPISYCPTDAKAIIVSGLNALTRPSFYWTKLLQSDKPLSEFPAGIWYDLVKQFKAPPSAGALLLASLEAMNDSNDIRYYGFTTKHRDIHAMANHHTDQTPRSSRHNWQAETDWLANRFA